MIFSRGFYVRRYNPKSIPREFRTELCNPLREFPWNVEKDLTLPSPRHPNTRIKCEIFFTVGEHRTWDFVYFLLTAPRYQILNLCESFILERFIFTQTIDYQRNSQ